VLALGSAAASANAAEGVPRSDSVLVRVDAGASAQERAAVGRALDAESARTLVAGWRAYQLPGSVTLAQARGRLAGADAAEAVQLDARLTALETPNDTHFGLQWPLAAMDAPSGWDAATSASPVTVAVIDTGVDVGHPDLAGRLWTNPGEIAGNGIDDDANGYVDDVHGWNFYDWTNQLYSVVDGDSHGTHVAGIIAAQRGNGVGVAGVADNARIMPLKFLKPGGGYTSDAIVAIQYAVAEGATVINASWGGSGYSQALCEAISQAGDAGVLFVAAAGNAGTDNDATAMWPANCPAATLVSVAATTSDDGLASFSNTGATQVDVGAPGLDVLSTVPGGYGYKSGTSMAAPQVSGIAAVVAGVRPGIAPWQIKAAITGGGDPVPALAGFTVSGRRVDLPGSLALSGAGIGPDTTPPDPFSAVSPAEGLATTSTTPTFRWSPATDAQSGVAGYRLSVDGAVAVQTATGVTQATPGAPLAEGAHHWSVSALDVAGNLRATAERTLLVDRTAPSAPVPSAPMDGAQSRGSDVTLVWAPSTDAVSGVAGYRLFVDGAGTATGVTQATPGAPLAEGAHHWSVSALDVAGNLRATAERTLLVDRTAPSARGRRPSAPPSTRPTCASPSGVTRGRPWRSTAPATRARARCAPSR
jgi:subtilisin family serine protease